MSPARIAELRALCDAATPGPWPLSSWDCRPYPRDGHPFCTFAIGPQHGHPKDPGPEHAAAHLAAVADSVFIAAARTALPELLDEVESDAAAQAFDAIAAACGCPEWEYPGQLVRDVRAVVAERDALRAQAAEHQAAILALAETYNARDAQVAAKRDARVDDACGAWPRSDRAQS